MKKDEKLDIVLGYPKLQKRMEDTKDKNKLLNSIKSNLKEISDDFSERYIKNMKRLLDNTLPKLYDGLEFDEGKNDFRQLVKDNSVVLVPNHQSHADYLAVNYLVYKQYGFPLYVAGGINLNIFPIGRLFRKSGCFFIRRSFGNDIVYKLTLEAYLFYLLRTQKPIEFFFEGGRSRTGKLLPPKYGLYQMLLDAHKQLKVKYPDDTKPLLFVPVSIAHEYVPEQKSLAKENLGGKKSKEKSTQLFGLFKLFSYQFGSVHISLGEPIGLKEGSEDDSRIETRELAFKCFREVGANMMVTPTSLLALVMLDEPVGALKWNDIITKAKAIIDFCKTYNIPFTNSLGEEFFESTLERSIDIMIGNSKVEVIGKSSRGHIFYAIKEDCRSEMLFFKNTILHHFLIPWTIYSAWINLFNGEITTVEDLKKHILEQRNQMKHEFYLPTVKSFMSRSLEIISGAVGRKLETLDDCINLNHKELYALASSLSVFSRTASYIYEAYLVIFLSLKELSLENPSGFAKDEILETFKKLHENEKNIGRVIKFSESCSIPIYNNALRYSLQEEVVEFVDGKYQVNKPEALDELITKFDLELTWQLKFNLRVI